MKNSTSKSPNKDWVEVLLDVIIAVLTLGFSHIRKRKETQSQTDLDRKE